jgi:autotransporter strand-loop-strand O-heptosyltransferase
MGEIVMFKPDVVLGSCPFLGHTGYANHAREFFTELNKQIHVRIRNFTHVNDISYLTQEQKDMCVHQTWAGPPHEIGTPFNLKPTDKILNIVLMETNHKFFWDRYNGPKIAFNVWESSLQPENFFNKLKEFDQVWVPTEWQRQCTIDQGIPAEKVFVVHEGVDLERFSPTKNQIKNKKFQFMIFGRWDYRKYTKELVQAFIEEFGKDEPVELLLSADNPYPVDTYKSTEERLEKYNLQDDRIKILHFPSNEDYVKYLQNGNCLLMASRSEGWALPAIECLACGTPTIITDWGAPLEFGKYAYKVKVKEFKKPENVFMQSNVPGIWAEPDFEDLKKQMRYVYENYDECKQHTMDGLEYIREFSWKKAADKAIEIISNMDKSKYYPTKLNIGCGDYPMNGYINIDKYCKTADVIADASKLPYENETVDEIYTSHLLEHLNKYEISGAVKEWYRVLKTDGKIDIEVPDFEEILKFWLSSEDKTGFAMDTVFGLQTRAGEEHKFGFTKDILKRMLLDVGFSEIEVKNIYSHGQECIRAIGYKKKIKYNDDIFVIDTYPNTEEKLQFLKDSIERTKKVGKPIALVTHYPLPEDVLKSVDYVIYDKNNPLSENYSLTYWAVIHKQIKVVTNLTNSYHGLCCLTSMKNATMFLKDMFNFIHFIEYDTLADLDLYLEKSDYYRARGKKFIGFDYHYTIPKQDGIITNIFSIDTKWFDEKMCVLRNWKEYSNKSHEMCSKINRTSDMILEHWMWNYFLYADMIKDVHTMSQKEKEEIIIRGNLKDQMDEEPEMHVRLSETDDKRLILFIIRDTRQQNENYWYKISLNDKVVFENKDNFDKISTYILNKKNSTLKVETNFSTKIFEIDETKTYTDTIFRFYNDKIKCLKWDHNHDEGFIDSKIQQTSDEIKYSFDNGAKVEILGTSNNMYNVEFTNKDTGLKTYEHTMAPNHWCSPSLRYFVNWNIEIKNNDKLVSKHDFDCTGKNVLIQLDSTAIGDTLAWVPYLDEFRKKHNCNVYGSTFHNKFFKSVYPEINWIDPNKKQNIDIYAKYFVGCRDNDYTSNKNNWRIVPLQQVCSDYLGLDYVEIRPKMEKPNKPRPIKEKYVCLSEHSTFQCKYWLYPNGWQTVIDYLNAIGYKVVVISKEPTKLKNIINKTNRPMDESINTIRHAELYMGVSSGPSWMAWALDVPVVLVSGYSKVWGEFQDNCARIIAPEGKCAGCFNDKDLTLDRGNWFWCPKSKNFECSTSITPEMVIRGVNKFIK